MSNKFFQKGNNFLGGLRPHGYGPARFSSAVGVCTATQQEYSIEMTVSAAEVKHRSIYWQWRNRHLNHIDRKNLGRKFKTSKFR